MRSVAEIIIIMPTLASTISTGSSKLSNCSRRAKRIDISTAMAEPRSDSTLRKRA